ncbi:hypothetical protein EVAR_58064_1 [Eumeta japonica]|uniref:Uncharacterized protein n=1 Tax=Eumeta variegata TaxID=151549 RepID=A0A4C2AF21_EUMVA|nr:hypothetical protein EVAR_58064_1 [Eumeta japonica]
MKAGPGPKAGSKLKPIFKSRPDSEARRGSRPDRQGWTYEPAGGLERDDARRILGSEVVRYVITCWSGTAITASRSYGKGGLLQ